MGRNNSKKRQKTDVAKWTSILAKLENERQKREAESKEKHKSRVKGGVEE